MSYILDALRRAEAQRARGRVPGLHEAGGAILPPSSPATPNRRPLRIALAVTLAVGALAIALLLAPRWSNREPAHVRPAAAVVDRPPVAPEATASALAASAAEAVASPATAASPPMLALPRTVQVQPQKPDSRDVPEAARPGLNAAQSPSTPTPTPARSASTVTPQTDMQAASVLPTREELPADVQRSLPAITVSGNVYSSDPRQRMIVINGELWHEGDQIKGDLVLEQIRQRDAIMRFRGQRFSVGP